MKKHLFRSSLILLLVFSISLCWISLSFAQEKVLRIGDHSRIATFDPAFLMQAQDLMLARNIYNGLMRYERNSTEIVPDLAEEWSICDDGLVFTFKIHEGIQFHKGYGELTAEDIKFSYERIMDPNVGSLYRTEFDVVDSIDVLDRYTLTITLKQAVPRFLHNLVGVRQGFIVSKKAFEDIGDKYGSNPIGTGPYIFKEWLPGQRVVIEANDDYFRGRPQIDRVVYTVIADIDSAVLALLAGDIDLMWLIPRESETIDSFHRAGLNTTLVSRACVLYLHMNTHFEPFSDVRVRRAVAHAINREEIIEYVYSGTGEMLHSLIPKGYFAHTEEGVPVYEYNPEKAKALLAEAGYPDGFKVVHDTFPSPNYLPVAIALQDQLARVGIDMEIDLTDQPTWHSKISSDRSDFSLFLPVRSPDPDIVLTQLWYGPSIPVTNMTKYDKLDDLIVEARFEIDPEKRAELYYTIQRKIMEDVPSIPMTMADFPSAFRADLKGFPTLDVVWGFDFTQLYYE